MSSLLSCFTVFGVSPHLHGICEESTTLNITDPDLLPLFSRLAGAGWQSCGSMIDGTGAEFGIPRIIFAVAVVALGVACFLSLWLMFNDDARMILCCRWPACLRRREAWAAAREVRVVSLP